MLGHADGPSRLPLPVSSEAIPEYTPADLFMLEGVYPDLLFPTVIARMTRRDPVLAQVAHAVHSGNPLPAGGKWTPFASRFKELSLHEGCALWGARVIIPKALQSQVLQILHTGHPGVEEMKMIARCHV